MSNRTFEDVNSDVKRAATEALAGTGVALLESYPSGRVIGIVETRDAYEIRVAVSDHWTRIISRQEISGEAGHIGGACLIAEVNAACKAGLADIHGRVAKIAKATETAAAKAGA